MAEGPPDSRKSSVLCNLHFSRACPGICGNFCFPAVVSKMNVQILTFNTHYIEVKSVEYNLTLSVIVISDLKKIVRIT